MNEMPEGDRALIERLNRSLDEAAARPDPALDAALAATRARIRGELPARRRRTTPWLWASGLALAAGLAAIMVIPTSPKPVMGAKTDTQAQAIIASPNEDPDMLDNMDMLQAMASNDHTQG